MLLAWIAEFIGRILKHILPGLIAEAKKPKKVKLIGADDELQKDIDNAFTNSINSSIRVLPQNRNNKTP